MDILSVCNTDNSNIQSILKVSSWTVIYSSNLFPLSFPPLRKNCSLLRTVQTRRLQVSQNPWVAKQAILLYKVHQVKWCAFSVSFCSKGRALKAVNCPSVTGFSGHFYKMQIYKVVDVGSQFPITGPSAVSRADKVSLHSFKVLTLHTQCQKCFWPLSPRLVITILCHIAGILSL